MVIFGVNTIQKPAQGHRQRLCSKFQMAIMILFSNQLYLPNQLIWRLNWSNGIKMIIDLVLKICTFSVYFAISVVKNAHCEVTKKCLISKDSFFVAQNNLKKSKWFNSLYKISDSKKIICIEAAWNSSLVCPPKIWANDFRQSEIFSSL